ncbi:MAG: TonB-dependent receptor, partial [Paludibacter sp.]
MKQILLVFLLLSVYFCGFSIENNEIGSITGSIFEKSSGYPLEFAHLVVKNTNDSAVTQGTTDKDGRFLFKGIPFGKYKINYSFIGFDKMESPSILVDSNQKQADFGKLFIVETSKVLGQVEVVGQKSTFMNSIDRKTFNVGQDLMSKSGSASDLMKSIPSVQVDVDGNVSLRGSENVTILIDGKPSAMMNMNSAAVLEQMSANSIDKIEIITNPSAKFKPDGTAGIINIVLKQNKSLGFNANLTANVGNNNRSNFNAIANYNSGKLNFFGKFGIRQDERNRINDIQSVTYDSYQPINYSKTYTVGKSRPLTYTAGSGFDYKFNDKNKIGVTGNYNHRFQLQNDNSKYTLQDNLFQALLDYDRNRNQQELQIDLEINAYYQHKFNAKGHELNLNYIKSNSLENEDNYYSNLYRTPILIPGNDNILYHHVNNKSQLSIEYTYPITETSKFEAGYLNEHFNNDLDLKRDTLNVPSNIWTNDSFRSNQFIRTENTNVLYATFEKEIGKFGLLLGIRGEQTFTNANLVTKDSVIKSQYIGLYPTLHLSYKLTDLDEFQFNYSHRIRRPQDEELNPFPQYQDLRNFRAGNPNLKPEDIHSFEMGYQLKKNSTTFLSTLYYRYSYNLITSIVHNLGNSVFLTSLENLSQNKSTGLEMILSTSIAKFASVNLATNTFYNTIDASALGYSNNKSTVSWSANGSVSFNLTKSTVWQFTSNYSAETLTPQGKRLPTFVMNTGIKQEIFKKKAAIILTVSDIFNSLRTTFVVDTPELNRTELRRRSSQTIYLGFS